MIEHMEIQVVRNTKNTIGNLYGDSDYTSTFVGEDGFEYKIHSNEIKSVRVEIGTPWLTADSNLEQVGKKH